MRSQGLQLGVDTYTAVTSACGKGWKAERAVQIFEVSFNRGSSNPHGSPFGEAEVSVTERAYGWPDERSLCPTMPSCISVSSLPAVVVRSASLGEKCV